MSKSKVGAGAASAAEPDLHGPRRDLAKVR